LIARTYLVSVGSAGIFEETAVLGMAGTIALARPNDHIIAAISVSERLAGAAGVLRYDRVSTGSEGMAAATLLVVKSSTVAVLGFSSPLNIKSPLEREVWALCHEVADGISLEISNGIIVL